MLVFPKLCKLPSDRSELHIAHTHSPSIGGYPKMSTFGTVVGARSDEGREEFLRYHSSAINVPSEATARIEEVSKKTGIFLVVGVIEKAGGTLYCTVLFVDPQEGLLAKHRKLMVRCMHVITEVD